MADDSSKELEHFKAELQLILEEQRDQLEQQRQRYQAHLSAWADTRAAMFRAIVDFALVALRGVVLANGAAAIAILAFIGHLFAAKGSTWQGMAVSLADAVWIFAWGVGLGVLAAGLSYAAQVSILEVKREDGTSRPVGNVLRAAAVIVGVCGLACFFWGIHDAIDAFSLASPRAK